MEKFVIPNHTGKVSSRESESKFRILFLYLNYIINYKMILNPLNAYPSWIQWTPDMWNLKFWAVLLKIHSNKYCLAYNCAGASGVLVVNIFRALLVYEILSV